MCESAVKGWDFPALIMASLTCWQGWLFSLALSLPCLQYGGNPIAALQDGLLVCPDATVLANSHINCKGHWLAGFLSLVFPQANQAGCLS